MKIRITRGIYGFRQCGNVIEKTKASAPFEVDDGEGERLIALSVAERVSTAEAATGFPDEEPPGSPDGEGDVFSKMGSISKKNLKNMGKEELIGFAEALGIEKSGRKEDLVERLKQCPVWAEDAEVQDEEDEPDLFAEDPE